MPAAKRERLYQADLRVRLTLEMNERIEAVGDRLDAGASEGARALLALGIAADNVVQAALRGPDKPPGSDVARIELDDGRTIELQARLLP